MNILLLIATISTFISWLAGIFIQSVGRATDFQAQSAKFSSSLSYVFLGRRALKNKIPMTDLDFDKTLLLLYQCAILTQQEILHYV